VRLLDELVDEHVVLLIAQGILLSPFREVHNKPKTTALATSAANPTHETQSRRV
jgi:hypothetical protein